MKSKPCSVCQFDGDELSQRATVTGRRFHCPRCGLELKGRAQLIAAGLSATIHTEDYVDPYELLGLDPVAEAEERGLVVYDPGDRDY